MSNSTKMCNYFINIFVILLLNVYIINAKISDKRLCADQLCTVPISKAKTVLRYASPGHLQLSFGLKEDVTIYSKSAGTNPELWGVEIGGKRGYVPHSHIREYKVLTKDVHFTVDTEKIEPPVEVPSVKEKIEAAVVPEPVQQPYEIHDGTKIYLEPLELSTLPSISTNSLEPKGENEVSTETPLGNDNLVQETEPLKSQDVTTDSPINSKVVEAEPVKNVNEEVLDSAIEKDKTSQVVETPTEGLLSTGFINSVISFIGGSENNTDIDDDTESDDEDDDDEAEEDDDIDLEFEEAVDVEQNIKESSTVVIGETQTENEHLVDKNTDKSLVEEDKTITNEQPVSEEVAQASGDSATANVQVVDIQTNDKPADDNTLQDVNTDQVVVNTELPGSGEVMGTSQEKAVEAEVLKNEEVKNASVTSENVPNDSQVSEGQPQDDIDKSKIEKSLNGLDVKSSDLPFLSQNVNEVPLGEKIEIQSGPPGLVVPEPIVAAIPDQASSQSTPPLPFEVVQPSVQEPQQVNAEIEKPKIQEIEKPKIQEIEKSVEETKTDIVVESTPLGEVVETKEKIEEQLVDGSTPNPTDIENSTNATDADGKQPDLVPENVTEAPDQVSAQTTTKEGLGYWSSQENNFKENVSLLIQESNLKKDWTLSVQEGNPKEDSKETPENNEMNTTSDLDQPSSVFPQSSGNEPNLQNKPASPEFIVTPSPPPAPIEEEKTLEPEASARNILWSSSIRKEIHEKHEHHQHEQHQHEQHQHNIESLLSKERGDDSSCSANPGFENCQSLNVEQDEANDELNDYVIPEPEAIQNEENLADAGDENTFLLFFHLNELFLVLIITAVTIVVFLWGSMYIDRSRKESPLIAKINSLEKVYHILQKENEILSDKVAATESEAYGQYEIASNEIVENLKEELDAAHQTCNSMEEQIQNLEKELSNSTEVGLELNRMLSEFLNSENGSDTLISNVDQLQRQLIEQQDSLAIKDTENHELRLELEISNTKVIDLQTELNKMAMSLLKLEEDKEQFQSTTETEIFDLKNKLQTNSASFTYELNNLTEELESLKKKYKESERELEIKTNEYMLLKESLSQIDKGRNNGETVMSLVDFSSIKAELMQLRKEKQGLVDNLEQESDLKRLFEKQAQVALQDVQCYKAKYDEADREKLEAQTKLDVLSNYFKEREAQLQKDLNKQESMWIEKQGEATSTIERIKYMQEELQNYKTQYESLKQEILAQEVDMKSQISILEKRAHENWVAARQAERKLDDAKQEAAQLRNRLTLRERSFTDDKTQNRLQSPLEQNGDVQISPMHNMSNDGVANPLLYNARDHLTTSPPPLSSLPPFMPPPPGAPFMPPPLGGVPMPPHGFLPPPPSMMPGDHRPPPLGRMSSPPLNSRYSPDSRYSPFRRNSPSPTSDDDYDRASPPPHMYRSYSPYRDDERRDFHRPPPNRNIARHNKGAAPYSSGSANSNESLEKLNRHNSKV